MTQNEISQAKDPDLFFSVDAMKRAALAARKLAMQTNTAIVVFENGDIVRRTAQQLQHEVDAGAAALSEIKSPSK